MAETFHLFPDLPAELRLKIWAQALMQARPDRRILIYWGRVVPFKQFISPLLLVNFESRTCAKAFYNVKLDIYVLPGFTRDEVEYLDKKKKWDRIEGSENVVDGKIHGYTDAWVIDHFEQRREDVVNHFIEMGQTDDPPEVEETGPDEVNEEVEMRLEEIDREEKEYTVDLEAHWSHFVVESLPYLGANSVYDARTSGLAMGAFYISPEHDVFITDYDFRPHFAIDNASKILGADFPSIQGISCPFVSEILSYDTCLKVSTLGIVRNVGHAEERHCVFATDKSVIVCAPHTGGPDPELDFESHDSWYWDERILKTNYKAWKGNDFPFVRTHFVLRYRDRGLGQCDFLAKLTDTKNYPPSDDLEIWEMGRFKWQGLFKHGFTNCRPGIGWEHEMMAHWDVGN